jgi:hypothetical protein
LDGYTLITGTGFDYNRRWPERSNFDAMRKAWEELRHELLPEWIREHPGTRPYAWWKFDAPEPRRHMEPHEWGAAFKMLLAERGGATGTKGGRPKAGGNHATIARLSRELGVPERTAKYESEVGYLMRLNLLTDDERKELL